MWEFLLINDNYIVLIYCVFCVEVMPYSISVTLRNLLVSCIFRLAFLHPAS